MTLDIDSHIDNPTAQRLEELYVMHGNSYIEKLKERIVKRFGMHVWEGDLSDFRDRLGDNEEKFKYLLCQEILEWYDDTIDRFLKMGRQK